MYISDFHTIRPTCTWTLLASFFLPSHLSFKNMYLLFAAKGIVVH